jgi:hypothetical protein
MSRHSHSTSKHSRSDANKEIDNTLSDEASSHSVPETAITNSMLHKATHISVDRHKQLEEAAYRLAEQRGFSPGHDLDDWFTAEMELDQRLAGDGRAY